ncbi:hypothetical protein RO07_00995 [Pandoraea pulmonicola]|uniref:Uncharacterized protein n=1 Tax=Pandoraea pulmonicola TaxID=93221 RepID=A0ABM5RVF3_PANPU|nr:hypothetical protein RO07_00995 [Pandoraea pulmonicola]
MIAASSQEVADASAINAALAATRPAVIGTSPACTMRRHGRSLKRSHRCSTPTVMSDDGPNFASDVTSMPCQPAICQPTSVTIIRFGPGAACPSANSALNSSDVIQ